MGTPYYFALTKQGILDVLVELNGDSRVNVELQIKMLSFWDKRSIFYLTKLFSENLLKGQDYRKLKRCVCISVLGFQLDDSSEYHRVYPLRDEAGKEFSDLLEIQIIELNKALSGGGRMDDWIRLFNVETKEELDMLEAQTKNQGILEAIKEVRLMGMSKTLKMLHDAHLKERRDQNARDDYVRNEGREEGRLEGEDRFSQLVLKLTADDRFAEIQQAAADKAYRDKLYQQYKL